MTSLLIGAYGPDMGGTARGIAAGASVVDGPIALTGVENAVLSPSWLAVRGDRLVATLEGEGSLAWFVREADGWRADGVTHLAGDSPCHAAFLDDDTVAVACYGDGAVVVARAAESAPVQRLDGSGSGPLPAQEGPHAHHVHVLPDGRVLTLDLGADRLHVHVRTDAGLLERVDSLALPSGTGPRDLRALPSGELALLGEWSCELLVLDPAGHEFEIEQILALPDATPGEDQAAALGVSDDGRFLYAGIRGADRVAVVALEDDGVRALGSVPSGGRWPRHLIVDGGLLHVANQQSDEVSTFRLGGDGMPVLIGSTTTPSPTCVVKNTPEALLS
ncbi:beta-propeller fold lactonase family protein [Protaetiibacter sp. SSC-01]|uniref:lactonase family protein n=1 Tax=Protaetiibacter sp. SSC-01 TaxID=2759943 RepID=UPI001657088D|nr:beta-propeller fold lactonase family protein [Protaetiibacter sp. SSC-01]QNO38641.1 beta-propeller fold lactonase family protein [Protaetiibacter sp. SSC-01]